MIAGGAVLFETIKLKVLNFSEAKPESEEWSTSSGTHKVTNEQATKSQIYGTRRCLRGEGAISNYDHLVRVRQSRALEKSYTSQTLRRMVRVVIMMGY